MTVLRDVRRMVQVVVIVVATTAIITTTVREGTVMWMEDPGEVVAEADGIIRIQAELAMMMILPPLPS